MIGEAQPLAVVTADVSRALADLVEWTRCKALPLWAEAGFDRRMGCFEEQLTFAREPVTTAPRRAMVQARQISVFAHAAVLGWFPDGAALATQAADNLIRRYGHDDGKRGFRFSLDAMGRTVDGRFDLYAHAFVLFGLAWAMRLDPKPAYRRSVDLTLRFLDARHADPVAGGYWDGEPRPDAYRRQNPHMHLFEALLELFEVTGDPAFLDRLAVLRRLCEDRFCVAPAGIVHELFDDRWSVAMPTVEPGHQMEWSWLLSRHDRHLGRRSAVADRLFDHAAAHGFDRETGRVVDEVTAAGIVMKATSRCWPHTEAIKAIVTQHERGRGASLDRLGPVLRRLRRIYARDDLEGGWIDHVDADDRPLSRFMPASSLYHLFLAVAEAARLAAMARRPAPST